MPLRRVKVAHTEVVLAANATYLSQAILCTDFKSVRYMVASNKGSANLGLKIQQSTDGNIWDVSDEATIAADTPKTDEFTLYGKFLRVSYKNGAVIQGSFRLFVSMVE